MGKLVVSGCLSQRRNSSTYPQYIAQINPYCQIILTESVIMATRKDCLCRTGVVRTRMSVKRRSSSQGRRRTVKARFMLIKGRSKNESKIITKPQYTTLYENQTNDAPRILLLKAQRTGALLASAASQAIKQVNTVLTYRQRTFGAMELASLPMPLDDCVITKHSPHGPKRNAGASLVPWFGVRRSVFLTPSAARPRACGQHEPAKSGHGPR